MNKQIQEYINHPGLNSTLLGAFADDPIFALQKHEPKTYYEEGKAFERLFQDAATGSKLFEDRFFVCGDVKIPDSFIEVYKSTNRLESHFVFTKKGEFNKTKESLHDAIFECIFDRDHVSGKIRYPIPLPDYEQMKLSVERLINTPVELFYGNEILLKELVNDQTLFQYPVYWECDGLQKRALYDMIVFTEINGCGCVVPIDLKYMANLNAMNSFFRRTTDKYSLQSMHYSEGLMMSEEFKLMEKYPQMPFLVATKTDPFFTQAFLMDEQSIEYAYDDYSDVCKRCSEWIKSGKKATGIRKTKRQKIWSN